MFEPRTIIEPFRIKSVEPIPSTTRDERRERHAPMLGHLLKHDIRRWARSYTSTLVDGGTRRGLLDGIHSRFKASTAQTPRAALRGVEAQ